jgi:hypothetical protein
MVKQKNPKSVKILQRNLFVHKITIKGCTVQVCFFVYKSYCQNWRGACKTINEGNTANIYSQNTSSGFLIFEIYNQKSRRLRKPKIYILHRLYTHIYIFLQSSCISYTYDIAGGKKCESIRTTGIVPYVVTSPTR